MHFEKSGARMYYEKRGEAGAPLVLLHGWGGSVESMAPLVRDFEGARRTLAVDFPGHGRSPEPPEPWEVTEYMEMTRALLEQESLAGADIVAHSFGGRVAILLASKYPHLVGRLLLTGCAGIPPKPSGKRNARTRAYKILRALADNGFTRCVFGERVDDWRESLVQKFGSADYRALKPSMRATFNRILKQDLTPCLKGIKAPTLLVWGENDTATPIWMGETMAREIPDAALIRFEGAGHFAYLEQYPRFLAIAREFLK
jgi:pimeloyl-ACP methyl ester carboxylesterase